MKDGMRVVYAIRHNPTGKIYIGSAADVEFRISTHLHKLRRGTHDNKVMQEDFDKYGEDYSFYLIDVIPTNYQKNREYMWMVYFDTINPEKGYNCYDRHAKSLEEDVDLKDFPQIFGKEGFDDPESDETWIANFRRSMNKYQITTEELAKAMHLSTAYVSALLTLDKKPRNFKGRLEKGLADALSLHNS